MENEMKINWKFIRLRAEAEENLVADGKLIKMKKSFSDEQTFADDFCD
jgi:hypothetical protein